MRKKIPKKQLPSKEDIQECLDKKYRYSKTIGPTWNALISFLRIKFPILKNFSKSKIYSYCRKEFGIKPRPYKYQTPKLPFKSVLSISFGIWRVVIELLLLKKKVVFIDETHINENDFRKEQLVTKGGLRLKSPLLLVQT